MTLAGAMTRRALGAVALMVLVGLPLPALAVPALQLYIPGATYDTTTQTWTTDQPTFSLWVVGAEQHKYSLIDDVKLYIALPPHETGTPLVEITNSNGVPTLLTAADFTFGTPAGVPRHGIFPTLVATYPVRDLLVGSAGVPVQDYSPGASGTDVGDIEVLTVENLGFTGLHFDVTGIGITTNGSRFLFAPFSHDAEATAPIPEPGTLLLLGSGLLGAGAWARRRRRRKAQT